jgi:hypothetical protein
MDTIQYTIIASGTLESRDPSDDYDMCEPMTTVYMIETEDHAELDEASRENIYRTFERRCYCAHDCCGHRNGGVSSITRMWEGRYLITVSTLRNY